MIYCILTCIISHGNLHQITVQLILENEEKIEVGVNRLIMSRKTERFA